jgi:hypothetical protein
MKKPKTTPDSNRGRSVIFGALALLAALGMYLLQLAWPGRLNPAELAIAESNSHLTNILHNPLNGLCKILDFAWLQLPLHDTVTARMAAVSLTLITIVVFYLLTKRWHGRVSAAYAVVLFAASTWLLHVGRLGDGQIMLVLTPLALLYVASWLNTTEHHNRAVLLFASVAGLALFTPGGVWFVAAAAILLGKVLGGHFKNAKAGTITAAIAIFVIFLAVLAFSLIRDTGLIRPWLGIPSDFAAPITMLKQWAGSLTYVVARGPDLAGSWLAHTPVLDVASTALLLFGVYLYRKHLRNLRTQLLLTFFVIGSILIALNGAIALSFIVGIIYLVATTGLAYFQHQWFKTFPLNPIARGLAGTLMVLLIACIVVFHTQRYFVAWQRSPATQATFQESSKLRSDLIQ